MDIKINIDDQSLQDTLARLVERGEDLSPAMQAIADALADGIEESFLNQASPGGKPWHPLSPDTIEERKKKGYWPGDILKRTGRLVTSIHSSYGKHHAIAGTNTVYAPTHQFGAAKGSFGADKKGKSIPWGDIPARPFLGVSEATRGEIIQVLTNYLNQSNTTA